MEQLWDSDFEDMLHLLVWEKYPTALQKELLSRKLAECMSNIPLGVRQVIEALPSVFTGSLIILDLLISLKQTRCAATAHADGGTFCIPG